MVKQDMQVSSFRRTRRDQERTVEMAMARPDQQKNHAALSWFPVGPIPNLCLTVPTQEIREKVKLSINLGI